MTMPETLKPDELVERLTEERTVNLSNIVQMRALLDEYSVLHHATADRILALQSDLERVTAERDEANEAARRWALEASEASSLVEESQSNLDRATTAEAALVKARTAETMLELIREEASKSNAPYGRSDSLAMDRIRLVLSAGEEENVR